MEVQQEVKLKVNTHEEVCTASPPEGVSCTRALAC
jgi:hypothetical protein